MTEILDPVASDILDKLEQADQAASQAVAYIGQRIRLCIDIGQALRTKKEQLGHGQFMDWFEASIEGSEVAKRMAFSHRTATRWMRLSEHHDAGHLDLESATGVRQAYVATGILPDPDHQPGGGQNANQQPRPLLMLTRTQTMLQSELQRRPLNQWTKEERDTWADRLKPIVFFYQQLLEA